MTDYIDLVYNESYALYEADYIPITITNKRWRPLFMFGMGPIQPEVLEGQRNNQNRVYVDSLIAYFKELDNKQWMTFYVEIANGVIAHSVHFSSDFVKKMCTFFPFCKSRTQNKLCLRLLGSAYSKISGSFFRWKFNTEFNLMDLLTSFEEKGHDALNLIVDSSISTQMVKREVFLEEVSCVIQISIDWIEKSSIEPSSHSSMINRLFKHEASKDFTLVSRNGLEMKCHKSILMIQSKVAAAMLSPDNRGMLEHQSGKLEMEEMSEIGLRKFIQLLYDQRVVISDLKCDVVLEIFRYCHLFGMKQLLGTLVNLLIQRNYLWYTPDVLVELYVLLKRANFREDLRKYLLCCMSLMKGKIRLCARYKELSREDSDDLLWSLLENPI